MVPALTPLLERVETKVRQARRRQGLQTGIAVLPLCLALGLLAATVAALLFPFLGVSMPEFVLPVAGLVLALVAAAAWAMSRRPDRTGAALALDRAFGLEERVVTLSTLTASQRETEACSLLVRQVEEQINKMHVPEQFPLQSTGRPWLAPLGAAIALVLAVLFAPDSWLGKKTEAGHDAAAKTKNAVVEKKIDLKEFKQANEERKKRLKEIGSADLNEIQQEIDQLLQKLEQTKAESPEAKLALEDVTRLTEKVRSQEQAKEKIEEIKKELKLELGDKLPTDKGPTEQFTQALAKADFEKAKQELQKLAEKMKKGELSKEEMKELAKQMANIKKALDEIAEKKEKLEALEKSNLDPETKAREKEKLEKEIEKMKDLAELAKQMKDAAEQMEKGDKEAAREALEKMADELQKMDLTEQEMGELKICEGDLQDLKNAIAGMKGKGGKKGKKGDPWGQDGEPGDGQGGQPGNMPGGADAQKEATEGGERSEIINDTKSEDTEAKSKTANTGKLTVVGEGPKQGKPGKDQVKNRAELTPAELDQAKQQASEALKQQKISQTQRDVVSEFYKNLAPGK
jgi:hypothetical protein